MRLSPQDSLASRLVLAKVIMVIGNWAAVVQRDRPAFVGRGVSKRTGLNSVHGPSVGWASLLGVTVP